MDDTRHVTAAELGLEPVLRVAPDLHLVEAARLLVGAGVDTLLVDTAPPTEVTEHDFVRALAEGVAPATPVHDLVREAALFVDHNVRVDRIVELMLGARRHGVVIVDESGHVLGMLTLPVAVAALLGGPPWLGALRVALRIDGTTIP